MKKFLLSDMHIGHKDAQYKIMDQAIAYIRKEAQPGDEIWGLGDWFHMYENGFEFCLENPMTQKFRDLAVEIPTKLIPGNHDHELEHYRDDPSRGNPISPIKLVEPFMAEDFWYCHGHEYDPSVRYIPRRLMWWYNHLPQRKVTPGNLRSSFLSERFIMLVYLVHSGAILTLQKKVLEEHEECKGIVLGHTHLPMVQQSPELLFLVNDGDMRHSGTFTIEEDKRFRQMTWDFTKNKWSEIVFEKP
jgi:UDP-2,3-diacylglucosamine pyrophosphatase LpxH